MKLASTWKVLFLLIAMLTAASAECGSQKEDSQHQAPVVADGDSQMSPARFLPDEKLKSGMSAILETMMNLHRKGSETKPAKLKAVGAKIEKTVNKIFDTCTLEPAADAALHPILAEILVGAAQFKKNHFQEGHDKIHRGLLKYGETFQHEGWNH